MKTNKNLGTYYLPFTVLLALAIFCILAGCQKTPEESAVVSKAEGLNESVITSPLERGKVRETDIPTHWQMEELRNKDRMLIRADLNMGEKKLGNLPVIEMKNHVLTEEELVGYFAEGETLYERQPYTKDVYEEVISRIENREGMYAASYHWLEQLKIRRSVETGMGLAPETSAAQEKEEIEFTTRFVDEGYEKAVMERTGAGLEGYDLYENREECSCAVK